MVKILHKLGVKVVVDNCYTVSCDYFATGEGVSYMILYTMDNDPLARFKEIFGDYFAIGAQLSNGLEFNCHAADKLISHQLRQTIETSVANCCNFEYYASIHVNNS